MVGSGQPRSQRPAPNGCRLADNAAEIMFSLATNSAVTSGLKSADFKRSQDVFPFVVPAGEH